FGDFATTWHFFTSLLQLAPSFDRTARVIKTLTYSTGATICTWVTSFNSPARASQTPYFFTLF
ncbi:MAG: hypothetical protein V4614_05110, partial [Pseudomonadota bacterium]